MDRITMLGTGHAMTSECFNTCFVYENENGKLLVDTGGGRQLLDRLRMAGIDPGEIDRVFISHRHTDHILGLPWLLRTRLRGEKPFCLMANAELCADARTLAQTLFPDDREALEKLMVLRPVAHGEKLSLLGRSFTFYDTCRGPAPQFGFVMGLEKGGSFVFNGDVPCGTENRELTKKAKWLMHEAFCLESAKPYGMKKHSSAAEAAANAAALEAEGLILVHCGDEDLPGRRESYTSEAAVRFGGRILVPEDLERIEL